MLNVQELVQVMYYGLPHSHTRRILEREGFTRTFLTEQELLNKLRGYEPPEVVCEEVLRIHILQRGFDMEGIELPGTHNLRRSIAEMREVMIQEQVRTYPVSSIKGPTLWEHLDD